MNRQMDATKAMQIPFRVAEKLGDFRFPTLAALSLERVTELMTQPVPLHRYSPKMSKPFYDAIDLIGRKYSGDATQIWSDNPSSADVVYRFLEFSGVGPKIATMAANILARDFKIPFSDYYSIDISVDVHVKRVFKRLGLATSDDSIEALIYRARALHPAFPGLLDYPTWEIGVNYCPPKDPSCGRCYMASLCPSRVANASGH